MAELFEVIMVVLFGCSWPVNLIKAYKARTAKGTSLLFLCLLIVGYISGIISKLINPVYMHSFGEKWYVLFFYVLNLIMIIGNLIVYFRNKSLDKKEQK